MKKTIILSILCFHFFVSKSQDQISLPSNDSIQSLLNTMSVPGVAIATIENSVVNRVISVGQMREEKSLVYDGIFNTASLAKSVTAFLVVRLIEEGKLSIEENLSNYWIDPDLEGDERVKLLTPHVILSHQTGFDNWRSMNEENKLRFNFDPGTKVGYSGEGYEYLRKALEKKFQRSFVSLVQEYIFDPLDMSDSYFSWSDQVPESRYAGEFKTVGEAYEITKSAPNAADDLLTTSADLGEFCKELLTRINSSEGEFSTYIQPQVEALPGINFSYGWVRFNDLPNDEYALFSAGSDAGVSAIMCLLPDSQRGIVILSNGENRGFVVTLLRIALGDTGNEIVSRFP